MRDGVAAGLSIKSDDHDLDIFYLSRSIWFLIKGVLRKVWRFENMENQKRNHFGLNQSKLWLPLNIFKLACDQDYQLGLWSSNSWQVYVCVCVRRRQNKDLTHWHDVKGQVTVIFGDFSVFLFWVSTPVYCSTSDNMMKCSVLSFSTKPVYE